MTTITQTDENIVLINTFTVDPAKADALLDLLKDATDKAIRTRPGFISANFHRSLDGRHVANYAQWRSAADLEAMMADPACREHLGACAKLSESFEPILYKVAAVHDV